MLRIIHRFGQIFFGVLAENHSAIWLKFQCFARKKLRRWKSSTEPAVFKAIILPPLVKLSTPTWYALLVGVWGSVSCFNYTKYVLKKQYYSFTIYVSLVDLLFSEKYRFLLVKYDIL